MKTNKLLLSIGLLAVIVISCTKENVENKDTGYLHGAFIINEGGFNNSNSSVSYFLADSNKLENNIFQNANSYNPGDVLQSFTVVDEKGVLVVNNSKKLEVVDMKDFAGLATITGFSYPRYAAEIDENTIFVSDGAMDGKVYEVDLNAYAITDSVVVGKGPEQMYVNGSNLYVANSGGWDRDSTISVIDIDSKTIVNTINVGDAPINIIEDIDGSLWVLCRGYARYEDWVVVEETEAKLVKINPASNELVSEIVIGTGSEFVSSMAYSETENCIYIPKFTGLYKVDLNALSMSDAPVIAKSFYGVSFDQKEEVIYGLDAGDYASAGKAYLYSSAGVVLDSLEVGIIPRDVVFN